MITSFLDNAGWYDDIADGPVTAHVKLHAGGAELQLGAQFSGSALDGRYCVEDDANALS